MQREGWLGSHREGRIGSVMGSSTEDNAGERCMVAVMVAAREVTVENEGKPMHRHTSEAEKTLIYDN